jgi:hypothetical protein
VDRSYLIAILLITITFSCRKDKETRELMRGKWDLDWKMGGKSIIKGKINFNNYGRGEVLEGKSKSPFTYTITGNTLEFKWTNEYRGNTAIKFNSVIQERKYQVWEQSDPPVPMDSYTMLFNK